MHIFPKIVIFCLKYDQISTHKERNFKDYSSSKKGFADFVLFIYVNYAHTPLFAKCINKISIAEAQCFTPAVLLRSIEPQIKQ